VKVLYADHTTRVSGAQRSLLELLRGLPADVEPVLASPPGPLRDAAAAAGIEHVPIRATAGSLKLHPLHTVRAVAELTAIAGQLRRLARRLGADVVHANTLQAGLAAGLTRRTGGPPLVVHVRDCLPDSRSTRAVRRWIGGSADELIAISRYTADCFGAPADLVIANAVDFDRFDPAKADGAALRDELGLDADAPVLTVIAQITPWKGQRDAIEALAAIRKEHPGVQLLIVGETKFTFAATRYDNVAYLAELRDRVAAHDLGEAVHFLGEREDVVDILAATDLLLAPSWEEPLGRTIMEGLAMEVPVIATNVGGPNEILDDGEDGLLLEPKQPERWAKAASALLADPERRRSMGARARSKALGRYGRAEHCSTCSRMRRWKVSTENVSACLRMTAGSKRVKSTDVSASASASALRLATRMPVTSWTTVSCRPPPSMPSTGRPAACDSTAAMPNSSTFATISAWAPA
jgi:glycosyltransferase involved in cell wall biosynthesis